MSDEIIDRNFDRWTVRECHEDDCVVLERFRARCPCARDVVHIPRDVLVQIADALKVADRE